ncbi:type II secretion system major pseudopilin GspG (plasmid) [Amphritea atlantica]|uniref:Type II secretion system core protein G n=1 Tax=Amphritea atlantica TaxID=355243 RepID=A0ABY5H0S2_9GAMM|nr:type II secretion system major pseudopilin GspG [Amphritea atlantica]
MIKPTFYSQHARTAGFTLLELLVVLVILGLLASLVGPQVLKQLGSSKTKSAALQIEEYSAALDLFRLEVGRYPNSNEGLEALISKPSDAQNWNGPYLTKKVIREDPWGSPYIYRFPGEHGDFDLYSLGADNKEGGDGENQDVGSWQ